MARLVCVDERVLWPQLAQGRRGQAASEAELLGIYPLRGGVPANSWYDLMGSARQHIDVLAYSGLFLPDGRADLPALLRRKAEEGVGVRLLYGDPACDAVALRGDDEGIGDGLAARIHIAMSYMRPAFDAAGIEARSHATTLYNSIYRFDDVLLVNTMPTVLARRSRRCCIYAGSLAGSCSTTTWRVLSESGSRACR